MYKIYYYYEEWSPIKGKIKKSILHRENMASKEACIQLLKDSNLGAKYIVNGNKVEVKKINPAGIPYTDLYKLTKIKKK